MINVYYSSANIRARASKCNAKACEADEFVQMQKGIRKGLLVRAKREAGEKLLVTTANTVPHTNLEHVFLGSHVNFEVAAADYADSSSEHETSETYITAWSDARAASERTPETVDIITRLDGQMVNVDCAASPRELEPVAGRFTPVEDRSTGEQTVAEVSDHEDQKDVVHAQDFKVKSNVQAAEVSVFSDTKIGGISTSTGVDLISLWKGVPLTLDQLSILTKIDVRLSTNALSFQEQQVKQVFGKRSWLRIKLRAARLETTKPGFSAMQNHSRHTRLTNLALPRTTTPQRQVGAHQMEPVSISIGPLRCFISVSTMLRRL